jgi:hypothetical protein
VAAFDRVLLVALAAMFSRWRHALVVVKPDTLLRWHRAGFRLFWRWRSRRTSRPSSRLSPEVVQLIRRMAAENRLWGAERIRGELLKLGIAIAKRTIQCYLAIVRATPPEGQRWSTFLRDGKFAATFDDVSRGAGIRVIRTPVRAPKAAAYATSGASSALCGGSAWITSSSSARIISTESSASTVRTSTGRDLTKGSNNAAQQIRLSCPVAEPRPRRPHQGRPGPRRPSP